MDKPTFTDNFTLNLFKGLQKDNLNYVYRGVFTQTITDHILNLTEVNMEKSGENSKIKKRVFTIMVEGLQNITRHQEVDDKTDDIESGIFMLQDHDDKYYITTGNPIYNDSIENLTSLLNKINSLDTEELKKYYKTVLNNNIISEKGGAGLGLIEMARKSGRKLVYDFVKINDKYSYFYLNSEIAQNSDTDAEVMLSSQAMENTKELHQLLNQENIVLIFNGIFNQESLLNILSIMENRMVGHHVNLKKKVFNIMVEMLQNIVKHGVNGDKSGQNPGIFFISQKGDSYLLNAGNYIEKERTDELTEKIKHVNSLSSQELNDFYENSLFNFRVDNNKESGLGLIELRLKTNKKINFEINPFNEKFCFFVIQTHVEL